jgi:tRNA-splicing ligase RtcB
MPEEKSYNVLTTENGVPIKAWTKGVLLEDQARKQLLNVAQLPFIFKWIAAMPDVHWALAPPSVASFPRRARSFPLQLAWISAAA